MLIDELDHKMSNINRNKGFFFAFHSLVVVDYSLFTWHDALILVSGNTRPMNQSIVDVSKSFQKENWFFFLFFHRKYSTHNTFNAHEKWGALEKTLELWAFDMIISVLFEQNLKYFKHTETFPVETFAHLTFLGRDSKPFERHANLIIFLFVSVFALSHHVTFLSSPSTL